MSTSKGSTQQQTGLEVFTMQEWIDAQPQEFDRYAVYQEHIKSLVVALKAACIEHDLPFFLVVGHTQKVDDSEINSCVAVAQHFPNINCIPAPVLFAQQAVSERAQGAAQVQDAIDQRIARLSPDSAHVCDCEFCRQMAAGEAGNSGNVDDRIMDLMMSFPQDIDSDERMLSEVMARADVIREVAALSEQTLVYTVSAGKRDEVRTQLEADVPHEERLLAAWRTFLSNSANAPSIMRTVIGKVLIPLVASYLPADKAQPLH